MSESGSAPSTLMDAEFIANPYPLFAKLIEQGPVRMTMYPGGPQTWVVSRYDDVRQVLTDPTVHKNPRYAPDVLAAGGPPPEPDADSLDPSTVLARHMLNSDGAEHTRLRKLVTKAFTARPTKALQPRVERIVTELLDQLAEGQEVDLIEALALPLTTATICGMLGIPPEDQETFHGWFDSVTNVTDPEEAQSAATSLIDYLVKIVADKRENPAEDIISELLTVTEDEGRLSESELLSMIFLLLGAGHESTISLIGNAVIALLQRPAELERVRADPSTLPDVIEEVLRFDAPFHLATFRYTTEPVEVGGVTIPARESVLAAIGAANHDPSHFERPDEFDVNRSALGGHLTFGHGVHYCMGAPLARLESVIALGALLKRFPKLRLAVDPSELQYRPSLLVRGVAHLPVVL
ncbi:cytochrome P450 [Streptomyces sp. NBRC 109706]|uniref:cytochrome P450 family protein n=1 Tax=Streptomyces sp. NBRC 109706 TaxID=1550035 RepID=UPI00082F8839|nr:cytochrome P450 [Streptomyces sp. NBRC 109706]